MWWAQPSNSQCTPPHIRSSVPLSPAPPGRTPPHLVEGPHPLEPLRQLGAPHSLRRRGVVRGGETPQHMISSPHSPGAHPPLKRPQGMPAAPPLELVQLVAAPVAVGDALLHTCGRPHLPGHARHSPIMVGLHPPPPDHHLHPHPLGVEPGPDPPLVGNSLAPP